MKGIILVGGTGTRLMPLTSIINKHLLPVGKYPMVLYGIERLRQAGIKDILIVMGKHSAGLYTNLLGSGKAYGVQISYRIQEEAGGIAEALNLAESFVEHAGKFVVLLGDNLFVDDLQPSIAKFMEQPFGSARVLLKEVEDAHRYGVPVFDPDVPSKILQIEEKPANPQSQYCVTGIYLYDVSVFSVIEQMVPSARGEFEITDVNNWYAREGQLEYDILEGYWSDAGTFESLREASEHMRDFALATPSEQEAANLTDVLNEVSLGEVATGSSDALDDLAHEGIDGRGHEIDDSVTEASEDDTEANKNIEVTKDTRDTTATKQDDE
ncbi:Glucose-1-phosphate thymidylyltransferase [compost metagenome]